MIQIIVTGEAAPQGSKKHVGRGIMVESSKKVKPWREAVERATVKETNGRRMFAGAVSVEACFTMRRPKRAKGREFPSVAPDLDKLLRSTFDGLTSSGVWEDDSRVVSVSASKVYPKQGKDALAVPGAVIRIWEAA
jgi:Holliday junction resolvase RusA-like endonuclease